jgi:hypothetical protein
LPVRGINTWKIFSQSEYAVVKMAKQTGPNPFIGRRGDLLGYRMAGQYYVRIISSLTAERVLTDPAFKQTMQYAGLLGKASKIASAIYRLLPEREHGFYRELTGMAMRLLKQGRTGEEAFEQLYNEFILPAPPVEVPKRDQVSGKSFADEVIRLIFSKLPAAQPMETASFADYPPS